MILTVYNILFLAFISHYFSIFYNCYVYNDFNYIGEYKAFFTQYFLLLLSGIGYVLYYKKFFRNNSLFSKNTIKDTIYTVTFIYQVILLVYLLSGMILSKYLYTFKEVGFSDASYLFYFISTSILTLYKERALAEEYKLNKEFIPYGIV